MAAMPNLLGATPHLHERLPAEPDARRAPPRDLSGMPRTRRHPIHGDDSVKTEHRALLTEAELAAVELHELGWGYRSIARTLGINMTTVRDRLDTAAARIAAHLDQEANQ